MAVYAIIIERGVDEATEAIERQWSGSDRFVLSHNAIFVREKDGVSLQELRERVGIGDGKILGVVMQVGDWNGHVNGKFVEWTRAVGGLHG